MKCLVSGASSGIGRDIARYLYSLGHEVILVSSNLEKLSVVSKELGESKFYVCDFKNQDEVDKLLEFILNERPEVVINNAGYGAFGFYDEYSISKDIDMINVNLISLHKITRTCLKYMEEGSYILNVSSSAGLMPGGPMMSLYYATKSYVRSYTLGIYKELKVKKKNIHVSVLCPGPVNTNFNNVAGGNFSVKALSSEYVAKYAVDNMFRGKTLIVPGFVMKLGVFFSRFAPYKLLLAILFNIQHKKR